MTEFDCLKRVQPYLNNILPDIPDDLETIIFRGVCQEILTRYRPFLGADADRVQQLLDESLSKQAPILYRDNNDIWHLVETLGGRHIGVYEVHKNYWHVHLDTGELLSVALSAKGKQAAIDFVKESFPDREIAKIERHYVESF